MSKKYSVSAIIGSELFGEKLRIWQALCILSGSVDENLLIEIKTSYYTSLHQTCSHAIRTCMEIFGAKMARSHPQIMLPRILDTLKSHNIAQQVLASHFILLGYLFEKEKDKTTENAVKNIRLMFQKNTIAFLDDLILENKPYFSNYEDLVKQYVK